MEERASKPPHQRIPCAYPTPTQGCGNHTQPPHDHTRITPQIRVQFEFLKGGRWRGGGEKADKSRQKLTKVDGGFEEVDGTRWRVAGDGHGCSPGLRSTESRIFGYLTLYKYTNQRQGENERLFPAGECREGAWREVRLAGAPRRRRMARSLMKGLSPPTRGTRQGEEHSLHRAHATGSVLPPPGSLKRADIC